MTGDEEGDSSMSQITQLEESVPSNSVTPPTTFINSDMTIENNCIYTAAIPSEFAGNFPEGTVLQIMPDSSIVAVAVKNLTVSNENSVTFKDSAFPIENNQNALNLSNMLTESNDNSEQQNVDIPVCTEENISDIDLSFLNETEENSTIPDPKCLNESVEKELQGIITDVNPQSLNLLQRNVNLPDSNLKSCQEQVNSEPFQDADDPPGNVVMIDVTKPIQLSQNSLIMVNGQKCILQHDSQSGQVIAYPVKEQEKPRRRRGRPRKISLDQASQETVDQTSNETVHQTSKETKPNENTPIRDNDSFSEEEREKGLLEIVNDDGALVRRSSRKRKKAKTLRDYETGNLKQELGSDVDEIEVVDKDIESCTRRKKPRGPGRPRKYIKAVEESLDASTKNVSGIKRQRGRPKKAVTESEPTQAFLVQTADGQILMMQVPLSSIPPGVSLQEMAQEIANKLNLGLNQGACTKDLSSVPDEGTTENTPEAAKSLPEPALQDHSIGSTTNFPHAQTELSNTNENSNIVDSTCQDLINDMNYIIGDPICESEEVILESEIVENCVNIDENCANIDENCANIDAVSPEKDSKNQNNENNLDESLCSGDNFCINIPSTATSIGSSSILCNLNDPLTDHDFFAPKSNVHNTSKDICLEIHADKNDAAPKELFIENDALKENVSFQISLNAENIVDSEPPNMNIVELLNKNVNSDYPEKLLLSVDKLKSLNIVYNTDLINIKKAPVEKQYGIEEMPNMNCPNQITKTAFEPVDAKIEVIDPKTSVNNDCLQNESVIESVECTTVLDSEYLSPPETKNIESSEKSTTQFIESEVLNSENQAFEVTLPLEEVQSAFESAVTTDSSIVTSSPATVIPFPEKVLPMLLPVQPVAGSKSCQICKMSYFTEEEIIEHFKVKHPKCICTECNYMNDHPYVIKRHASRHSNQGAVCKLCNKTYKDMYILKMHIKMVHLPPDVLYECEICEKKFTRKAHLKRHMRIHALVKQYQCPHCQYKGCEKSDITKHLLIHEEPKFKCEICGKAFRHAKNKDLHLKRHSGQRDYKCAACGFFGYTYTDIRKHIERRHAIACSQCKQVFSELELLKEHKRIGTCQSNLLEENNGIKIEGSPNIIVENKETTLLDEMSLDILETEEQPQVMTISECSEETLSALQSGQLIMTSVEGIFNTQDSQVIVEGCEDNIISSESLPVVSLENDPNKLITFVTSDGKNVSFPLKNCPLPLECIATVAESSISEQFILTNSSEIIS